MACWQSWQGVSLRSLGRRWSRPLLLAGYAILTGLVLHARSTIRAATIGLLFAAALHGVGQHWRLTSLFSMTGAGPALSLIIGAAYLLCLGLFTAIPAAIYVRFFVHGKPLVLSALAWAALLSLGECARGLGLNGLSTLSVGYAFVNQWPAHWLPLVGLHGCSFLALCLASLGGHCLTRPHTKLLASPLAVGMVVAALALWVGGLALRSVTWVEEDGKTPGRAGRAIHPPYRTGSCHPDRDTRDSNISFTTRTARRYFATLAIIQPIDWLTTVRGFTKCDAKGHGNNSIFHIGPTGDKQTRYDKIRLMPVGEYRPWGLGWLVDRVRLPLQDLTAGAAGQGPFTLGDSRHPVRVAIMVCLEDHSGQAMRSPAREASLILNPTNLSWFEGDRPLQQSLQIAQARALETGRHVLRVGNTGITAHIDHQGKVIQQLSPRQSGQLSGYVQPMIGLTPFVRFGNGAFVILVLFALAACRLTKSDSAKNVRNMCPEQTSYIGYSHGSLLAAHTAPHWANQRRIIDNVALAGSPIDNDFPTPLRTNTIYEMLPPII